MPESMYDKLGELLKSAIDSGNFFDQTKKPEENKETEAEKPADSTLDSAQKYTKEQENQKSVHKSIHIQTYQPVRIVSVNQKLIKYAHPDVQKACTLVGVVDGMSLEEAKKQYHKKLLRFHPDQNADTEVMRKITKEKTAQLVAAWALIEKWYSE